MDPSPQLRKMGRGSGGARMGSRMEALDFGGGLETKRHPSDQHQQRLGQQESLMCSYMASLEGYEGYLGFRPSSAPLAGSSVAVWPKIGALIRRRTGIPGE